MKQLEEVERQIVIGQDHIARQRELIANVERSGQPGSHERSLLATFETLLRQHERRRDQLRRELGE